MFLAIFFGTYNARALRIIMPSGSYYDTWGQAVHTYTEAIVSFTAYPTSVDVWEYSGYVMVLNGTANCSRGRLFDNNWHEIYPQQHSGSPFPISAPSSWIFDSYTLYGSANIAYSARGMYQVSSDLSGGTCGYGGGTVWEKPGMYIAWNHWATST
jgi:hypothetical protein